MMAPSTPELSAAQRRRGARNAANARAARAQVLERLKRGEIDVKSVLALSDRDTTIARLRVFDVVKSLRGVGPIGARRVLTGTGIDETRRLGGLGGRQRRDLIEGTVCPAQWRRNFRTSQ
ncbi:integration host factor, actinobacterial type [Rhodococcus erythropolis]|uniref:integration host factor, actinobacterial type n=1 Tax=Rhodococcus erythropolis TaxID=1833 RepID=UPI0008B75424|nr:integration host factor, actinobacterial type [Rhodococcus erythropolis]OFV76947.1 hypothetical protein RERY_23980 [Rhodococcus erythropolis]